MFRLDMHPLEEPGGKDNQDGGRRRWGCYRVDSSGWGMGYGERLSWFVSRIGLQKRRRTPSAERAQRGGRPEISGGGTVAGQGLGRRRETLTSGHDKMIYVSIDGKWKKG